MAAAERTMGLRDSMPSWARQEVDEGRFCRLFLAWEEPDRPHRAHGASFTATNLFQSRASARLSSPSASASPVLVPISAPGSWTSGRVIAAVSISGPIERMGRQPGRQHAAAVVTSPRRLTGRPSDHRRTSRRTAWRSGTSKGSFHPER